MNESSYIEISKSALKDNLKFIRSVVGEKCIVSSVVKGNAYGHSIETFVPMAEDLGVNHFSVFSAHEAQRVMYSTEKSPTIMIMGAITNEQTKWAITNNIEFFVFEEDRLLSAIGNAKELGKKAHIHIEIETGMNRTGFSVNKLGVVMEIIRENLGHIHVAGVCSHMAGAESVANYLRVIKQISKFKKQVRRIREAGIKFDRAHLACSAGIINYPNTAFDMVRVGILQYGFWPSKEVQIKYFSDKGERVDPLTRVISWKSYIMSIKNIRSGDFIGYGTTMLAETDMKIAVVPVGYSDGYSRSLSNTGRVLVKGHRMSVVGIVNMNMIIVDVTNIPDISKGDEVVLIGEQGDYDISVASFGELSNQLNYELLTRIPETIQRKVID